MIDLPQELLDRLRAATSVVALTGAGTSAESGIPTFREAQTGFWARYRPEDLASRAAFTRNARMVWQWYAWRRELARHAEPNPGHLALAALEHRIPSFSVITQNVDGLHQKAGSRKVVELHGNLFLDRCFREGEVVVPEDPEAEPPTCPHCGGPVRPGVVWFGESLPEDALASANTILRSCQILLVAGTSGLVWPAAGLPGLARSLGAWVVEINPEPTILSESAHLVVRGTSGLVLARIAQELAS